MSGSIRANHIKAKNVVKGMQVQGEVPKDLQKLKGVAAVCAGDITADRIDADNVVSGLQVLAKKTPQSMQEFRDQLVELRGLVGRLAQATPPDQSDDVKEIGEFLDKSQAEAAAGRPRADRISRWLKNVHDIASGVNESVTTFTAIATAATNLIAAVGTLFG
jgi:ABC-type transporter Mla subunit MlaD